MPNFTQLSRQVAAILVLLSLLGAWRHGLALDTVRVSLLAGESEVGDGLAGVPDYRLDVKGAGKWIELGVFQDSSIGAGLEWSVPGSLALDEVTELRLVEVDLARDDVLESRPVNGLRFKGQHYAFELQARRDFKIALRWFFDTPVGALTAVAIVIFGLLALLLNPDVL